MLRTTWLLIIPLFFTVHAIAAAQSSESKEGESKADPRVKAALSSLEVEYTILDDGAFQVTYAIDSERTQVAFINSLTDTLGTFEIREVTSTAYKVSGMLPADLANRLLHENDRQKLGAWRIIEEEGATYVVYAAQVDADADAETLDVVLDAVTASADAMEEELTGKDEY